MTTQTPTDILAGLRLAADNALAPLSAAMSTEAPAGARAAHGGFQAALNNVRATAHSGAGDIQALREKAAEEHRTGQFLTSTATGQQADAATIALTAALKDHAANAVTTLAVVEAEAKLSLVPPVSSDPAARQLARSEIEAAVAGKTGAALVSELGKLVGQSEQLDSELMSSWGSRMVLRAAAGQREGEELTRLFTAIAIAKLAAVSPPRSAMTAAAVKILEAIPKSRGAIAAIASSSAIAAGLR